MVTKPTGNPNGRPKKPAALALLHGDRGRMRPPVSALATGDPVKPGDLSEDAGRLWDQLAPDLTRLRLLGVTDVPAFVELLEAMVLTRYYRARMRRELAGDPIAAGQTPAVYQYRTLLAVINVGWAQFGMTPAARTRLVTAFMAEGAMTGGNAKASEDLLSG